MRGDALAHRVQLAMLTSHHLVPLSDVHGRKHGDEGDEVEAGKLVGEVYAALHGRKTTLAAALRAAQIERKPAGREDCGGFYWGFYPVTRNAPVVGCSPLYSLQKLINEKSDAQHRLPAATWGEICDPDRLLFGHRPGRAAHLMTIFGATEKKDFQAIVDADLGPEAKRLATGLRRGKLFGEKKCEACSECGRGQACTSPRLGCTRAFQPALATRLRAMGGSIVGLDASAVSVQHSCSWSSCRFEPPTQ